MSRMLKVLLLTCVAAASVAAAAPKKNAEVEKAVKSELLKRMFTTKILVGSYIPCPPTVNTAGRTDAIKPVDTELALDGSVQYLARANCFYPTTPGVIDLGVFFDASRFYVSGPFADEIPSGSSVWVRSVDFREDRVELNVVPSNNASYGRSGKIKYMLGADYRTWPAEKLMEVIASGIVIPAYEKLVHVKWEFEQLQASLHDLESKYNSSGGDLHAKLVNAIAMRDVLQSLQKNRAEFASLGKSDPQAGAYSERLNALASEISKLSDDVRKERITSLRGQLQAQLQEISQVQSQLRQKAPATLAEWQQRTNLLVNYSTLLYGRQKLLGELKNENEMPSAEDYKFVDDSLAEIATLQKSLEHGQQTLELADLTSQYSQLTRKRAQMLDAYSRAFATPKERSALQDLVNVLGQMATNRDRAATLGDKAAPAQLVKCKAEQEKYRKK